jgi:hypothetical protein
MGMESLLAFVIVMMNLKNLNKKTMEKQKTKNEHKIAKDWITETGFRAVVAERGNSSKMWRCGYVGVPKGNFGYKKDFIDNKLCKLIKTNREITFSGHSKRNYPIDQPPKPLWWIGFDSEKDLDFNIKECELLSKQLKKLNKDLKLWKKYFNTKIF